MQINPESRQAGWGRSFAVECWGQENANPTKGFCWGPGGRGSLGGRSAPSAARPTQHGVGCN